MFSQFDIMTAKVVIKGMWAAMGETPLVVQLAIDGEAQENAWEYEAKKYLVENARRRHYGLSAITPQELVRNQNRPNDWEEMCGDAPGPAEALPEGAKLIELPH